MSTRVSDALRSTCFHTKNWLWKLPADGTYVKHCPISTCTAYRVHICNTCEISSFFNIYRLPELAYWSIALSVTIKEGNIDNSWWDGLDTLYKSKTYFYNYLTTMEKKRDIYDENTRDTALNTIRIVLKSMQHFVDILPEFCRSPSYICSK